MKKLFLLFAVAVAVAACQKTDDEKAQKEEIPSTIAGTWAITSYHAEVEAVDEGIRSHVISCLNAHPEIERTLYSSYTFRNDGSFSKNMKAEDSHSPNSAMTSDNADAFKDFKFRIKADSIIMTDRYIYGSPVTSDAFALKLDGGTMTWTRTYTQTEINDFFNPLYDRWHGPGGIKDKTVHLARQVILLNRL